MDVRLPNGVVITNVPEGTTKAELAQKLGLNTTAPEASRGANGSNAALGTARSFTEGLTLGWGDEIGLGLATLMAKASNRGDKRSFTEIYDEMRKNYNAEQRQYEEEHPALAMGSTLAGGVLSPVSLGGVKVLSEASKPVLAASMMGAASGAGAGAGFAPDAESAGDGALYGAALGGAIPPLAAATSKVVGPVVKSVSEGARRAFETPKQTAARMVAKALKADQADTAKMASFLNGEGRMVDYGGENIKQLAQTAASAPGEARNTIRRTIGERVMGSTNRLLKQAFKGANVDKGAYEAADEAIKSAKGQAGPLYSLALSDNSAMPEPDIRKLIVELDTKAFNEQGTTIGKAIGAVRRALVQDAGLSDLPKTGMLQLHNVKIDLDQRIANSYNTRGESTPLTRELMSVKNKLLKILDGYELRNTETGEIMHPYAEARKIFDSEMSVENAIRLGRKILTTGTDESAAITRGLSEAEYVGYRIGAAQAISDKLKSTITNGNAANRVATPLIKERIRPAFPTQEEYNNFIRQIDRENIYAQVKQAVSGGSPTAERLAAMDKYGEEAGGAIFSGRPISAAFNLVKGFFNQRQIPEPVRNQLADMLVNQSLSPQGPAASKELLVMMRRYNVKEADVSNLMASVRAAAGGVGGRIGGGKAGAESSTRGSDNGASE